jgi:GNAT superfamily N-acetyltransferase
VHEKWRKSGAGSELYLAIEKLAYLESSKFIWTMARNSATSFYEKMGLRIFGEIDSYEYGPHFWMQKSLIRKNGIDRI